MTTSTAAGRGAGISDEALKLSDRQEAELHRLIRLYRRETDRCRVAKAYVAGCVMAGAVLETALILMVNAYPDEASATNKLAQQDKATKPLVKWNLAELLRVAKAADWLPSALEYGKDDWDRKKAKVGDYAEVLRQMRNLAHPSRYMEDHYGKRVKRRHLELAMETINSASTWLYSRIEKSLIEAMKAEDEVPIDNSW